MIESEPDRRKTMDSGEKHRWRSRTVLIATCALVIGVYAFTARSGALELLSLNPGDTYYNLLVQGFRSGQLSLKKEVPAGLRQLPDPYDPNANAPYRNPPYRMLDMSYYQGRFYLYFGVTPALLLFWPYVALTGRYLLQKDATVIFCAIGFLASAGLLCALWRRYFAEASVAVVAACILALGLATGVPILLSRSDVYEVPISCGYMLTMLALVALWCALHDAKRTCRWLTMASLAYGLAVGARPSLLPGAIILLVPLAQARRQQRNLWPLLVAATSPIVLIGVGLMVYNSLRFNSPFDFGIRYQLAADQQLTRPLFGWRWVWFNFRIYFLEPARWMRQFPFVREIAVPALPADYARTEAPFGILTNIPVVWLALAVPLAWRRRSAESGAILRWFVIAAALLFGTSALTMSFFSAGCIRYQVEFLPALVVLAVIGILSLDRAVSPISESELADRLCRRRAVRWGCGLLLGFSVAFNLLASVVCRADGRYWWGVALAQRGQTCEAIRTYEAVLQIRPDFAEAHYSLGVALTQLNQAREAREHYEQAVRLKPDFAEAHYNLAVALEREDQLPEAIEHYEQAIRSRPDFAEAHENLGLLLTRLNRTTEAMVHYERAVRSKPDSAEAHYSLGVALRQAGNLGEAIGQYELALRFRPDYAEAHNGLGNAWLGLGKTTEAIKHYEQALQLKPDFVEVHFNLGSVLLSLGKTNEAITRYEQAVRLKPDFVEAQNRLARLRAAPARPEEFDTR
jgi:tetratricopeptide (TPR) repeat protein